MDELKVGDRVAFRRNDDRLMLPHTYPVVGMAKLGRSSVTIIHVEIGPDGMIRCILPKWLKKIEG